MMNKKIIYYGEANEDGEYQITVCPVITEDDVYYKSLYRKFHKSKFEKEIDRSEYDAFVYEEYAFWSFDKEKVVEFLNEKKKYFIQKTKALLDELEKKPISIIDE